MSNLHNKFNQPNNQPIPINEGIIKSFMENQAEQIALEKSRVSLENEQNNRNYEYALKVLEANNSLLKDAPNQKRKNLITGGVIAVGSATVLLGFFSYWIAIGKEQIVLEIIKILAPALVTGISGYFYGKSKGGKKEEAVE